MWKRYGHAMIMWREVRSMVMQWSCYERYGHAMIMWWQVRPCSDHIILQSTGKLESYVFCGFKSLYEKKLIHFSIAAPSFQKSAKKVSLHYIFFHFLALIWDNKLYFDVNSCFYFHIWWATTRGKVHIISGQSTNSVHGHISRKTHALLKTNS